MSYTTRYVVPAYQDISHFRAPYKNYPLAGVGGCGCPCPGMGEDIAPPPPDAVESLEPADVGAEFGSFVHQKGGKHYWTKDGRAAVLAALASLRQVFIGGPTERVALVPFSQEEHDIMAAGGSGAQILKAASALTWVEQKKKEGKVVFAPVWVLAPIEGRELAAIPAANKAAVAEAASTNQVAILEEPGLVDRYGYPAVAAGAVLLIGGGLVAAKSMRKRRRASIRFG